jgi:asparagine synthase (glutamine-hydrolysing)
MMAIDYKTFMVDDVLCKVDRASMSVSLEGREPLLDHRLAQYMARVPVELKYQQNKGKYLLREVLKKYIPSTTTDKPKAGFTIPLKSWLLNELKQTAIEALESNVLKKDEIFNEKALQEVISDLKKNKIKNSTFIWMIMMYVQWRQRWE